MGDADTWLASLADKLGTPHLPEMVVQAAARGLYDIPPKPLLMRPPPQRRKEAAQTRHRITSSPGPRHPDECRLPRREPTQFGGDAA
jgi:hypothetical protein